MPRTEEQNIQIREKTKTVILDAALRLFAKKGFHGTSISDIAKEAGVSKGLAYNYFESKIAIAEGIIQSMVKMGAELAEKFKVPEEPYDKLKVLLDLSFDFLKVNEDYWKLILSFSLQPDVIDYALKLSRGFNDKLLHDIEDIMKKLKVKNPAMEARLLGAMVDGASLHYIFDKDSVDLDKYKKAILKKYKPQN